MKYNNLTIIIADDDEDDKALIQEALVENGIKGEKVILTSDGEELLNILPRYANNPCIVFLDLNMPRKDGRRALAEIKSNEILKHIPVIIFTTSSSKSDITTSYKLGSNTYFTKPFNYQDLVNLISTIKTYWFEKASLGVI